MKKATVLKTIMSSFFIALAIVAPLLCFSEAKEVKGKEIAPCEVNIKYIETIYTGKEGIFFSPIFEIYNSSTRSLQLSYFSYELKVNDFFFAGQQVPASIYLPPKGTGTICGALAANWLDMSLWTMQEKGVGMGEAIKVVIPFWKSWGGKLFNPKLKEFWQKTETFTTEFLFNGHIELSAKEQMIEQNFTVSWEMKSRGK